MARTLPSRYRYHLFFIGILLMSASGFIQRYAGTGLAFTAACVVLGFLLFVASIALP